MAKGTRIRGLTIELGADTQAFSTALKDIDSQLSKTQKGLKDVNKLLKLDPSNTELLSQKQGYLSKAIEQTGQRIEELKKAQATMDANGVDKNSEQYKALEREIIATSTQQKGYQSQLEKTETALNGVADATKDAGTQSSDSSTKYLAFKDALGSVADVADKVSVALKGVADKSLDAFRSVDEGADIIVTKTGASGEALDQMNESMKNIATSIPTDFATAGTAIGEVNTRFGLTGDALEDLSTKFIQFAEINGTDVNSSIDTVQKALSAFGLSADDAGAMLDTLNVVGQNTGVSMDTLTSAMVTNATAFQEMGFSAADTAELLGNLEKSGVDASLVLTGLKKAQAEAAKSGTDMGAVLSQAFSSSGDAVDIFGAKAGPQLYAAMQNGTLSMDMLTASGASLNDQIGSVSNTYNATLDPIDQLTTMQNQMQLALADVGATIMETVLPAVQGLQDLIHTLTDAWNNLDPGVQKAIVSAGVAVVALSGIISVVTKVSGLIASLTTIAGGMGVSLSALAGPIGIAIAAITAIIAVGTLLYQNWDTITAKAAELKEAVVGKFQEVGEALKGIADGLSKPFRDAFDTIRGIFTGEISLPHIKLPHFTVTGSKNPLNWIKDGVPKFSVSWYAKAMDQPYTFNRPTLIGVGEAGSESVVGTEWLKQHTGNQVTINMTVNPSQKMDEKQLADYTINELTTRMRRQQVW